MLSPIQVVGVKKSFVRHNKLRPRTLKEVFIRRQLDLRKNTDFMALEQVSLEVNSGELVGIIGHNGAGKSTLLRLIGGVGLPDEGQISIHGKIGALLELGAGFHPELTGRENIFVNGIISGLTHQEVARRFADIVKFSELEDSINNPLRTYSSGMQLRLAFAVSVHTSPDILLIDEVLAVGDLAFQHKCLERIEQFRREGCAILIVSHDIAQVRNLCDRAIWMSDGRVVATGEPGGIVDQYERSMLSKTEKLGLVCKPVHPIHSDDDRFIENRTGTMEMEIFNIRLLNMVGTPVSKLQNGDALIVEISYVPQNTVQSPIFSVTISDKNGTVCLDINTSQLEMPNIDKQGIIRVNFERLDLTAGNYFVDVGAYAAGWGHVYDHHWHVYSLSVLDTTQSKGILNPPHQWELPTQTSSSS